MSLEIYLCNKQWWLGGWLVGLVGWLFADHLLLRALGLMGNNHVEA
jgi:hypothetical protein